MKPALNQTPSLQTLSTEIIPSEVLYVTECSHWGEIGYETVATAFRSVTPVFWSPGTPKPDLNGWHGDWIISFKSDLILSRTTIESAKKGALNFHPSPPKYRGVGGYWWALHNNDEVYGVTCHHMDERIDHGAIIKTESFPIWPLETVESLKHRTALHSLGLLNKTLDDILNGKRLTTCGVKWEQHLYTYKELAAAQKALASNDARYAPAFDALKAITQEDSFATEEQGRVAAAQGRRVA